MAFSFLSDRRTGLDRRSGNDRRHPAPDRRRRPSIQVVARPSQERGVLAELRFEIRRSDGERRVNLDRRAGRS